MNTKKFALVAVAGVTGLLGVASVGVAFADTEAPGVAGQVLHLGRGPHGPQAGENRGRGPHGTTDGTGIYHEQVHAAAASALGITVDDLEAQLAAGKTVADIAQERGIDLATVQEAMRAARPAGRGPGMMGNGAGTGECPNAQ